MAQDIALMRYSTIAPLVADLPEEYPSLEAYFRSVSGKGVMHTCFSTFTANGFFYNLALEVGTQPGFRKSDNFRRIQAELTNLSLDKRRTPVLIIDEANYINNAIFNDFKLLFNFEMDSRNRAVVLLCGHHSYGNYLRIPDWAVGLELGCLRDRFWNLERLTGYFPELSRVDAISIVDGLAAISREVNLSI